MYRTVSGSTRGGGYPISAWKLKMDPDSRYAFIGNVLLKKNHRNI